MATEIEHKYLVDELLWKQITPHSSKSVKQGYLSSSPDTTIRIRTMGDQGFITVKGRTIGSSRPEYEYEIPLQDAQELLASFCKQVVEKTRHYVDYGGNTWEVDEFHGLNEGLVVAEIELLHEEQPYEMPNWISRNVTRDNRYSNASLAQRPYSTW